MFKLLLCLARITSLYYKVLETAFSLCLFLTRLDCFLQFTHSWVCRKYFFALNVQLFFIHLGIWRIQQQGLNSIRSSTNIIMSKWPYWHLIDLRWTDKNFIIVLMIWLLPNCLEIMVCSSAHSFWSSSYWPSRVLHSWGVRITDFIILVRFELVSSVHVCFSSSLEFSCAGIWLSYVSVFFLFFFHLSLVFLDWLI